MELYRQKLIPENPALFITPVRKEEKPVTPFTDEQVNQLMDYWKSRRKYHNGSKYYAIFQLMYSTGCRIGAIIKMKLSDIYGDEVLLHEKGEQIIIGYLTKDAIQAINDYLPDRFDDGSDFLFTTSYDSWGGNNKGISKAAIEKAFKKAGDALGIENCHPHRFRTTNATKYVKNGSPMYVPQKALGHSSLETTKLYVPNEITDEFVKQEHKRVFEGDNE